MCYTYNTAEGSSDIKKGSMTSPAGKRLELEITMLAKISHTKKDKMSHFLPHTETRLKKIKIEKTTVREKEGKEG